MKKLLLLMLLLSANTTFNTEAPNTEAPKSLYTTLSTKLTNIRSSIKPYSDKVLNSKWLIPSLGATAATIIMYCNYASYRDYQQLKLIPKEDSIEAAKNLTVFIFDTVLIGRQAYTLSYDYDGQENLSTAFSRGYFDIINGNTSFVMNEEQMKAFRLLCGLPLKVSVGFFGSLTVLSYALQEMISKIKATE